MDTLSRSWLVRFVVLLFALCSSPVSAADESDWTPTPPRLSHVEGEVSYWRSGADEWARAWVNLALAEGDALYTARDASIEVQFGPRSFVRADENSELALLQQDERRIQFKLTGGRASFDLRSMAIGEVLEVSTPDAVFVIEHPGYYRVEVNRDDTHFITRRGGEATMTTADGRRLSVYPSEEIVITAGAPARVATYAAPPADAWDRWNDARSERIGDSVSARYLPPGVYGVEELDHYGRWRMVAPYGPVWIPYDIGPEWVPYSTGYWVWDPYYEWTWVDEAPWGWAPYHYGRWVYIDGYWAWAPGPVVRRPVYAPALVAFLIRDHDVSLSIRIGLPGLWWVALSWGEPVLPWWGPHRHRGHPRWDGWGGPRIVNKVVIKPTTVVRVEDIHFHNASLPRAILNVPADRFGRERVRATVENRYRHTDFAPVRGALPVKPARASLFGGAPRGMQPPREVLTRPVVSTRIPRERAPDWKDDAVRLRSRDAIETRIVVPRRSEAARPPQRPPFGVDAGPERPPDPRPPRYEDIRKSVPPAARPSVVPREAPNVRDVPAAMPHAVPPAGASVPRGRAEPMPQREGAQREETRREETRREEALREEKRGRPLPGQPASQIYRGRGHDDREQPR